MLFGVDLQQVVETLGYIGIVGIIFAETGIFFVGMFLPGDSLLFTAGLLASQGMFQIVALLLFASIAAILGGVSGYAVGAFMGPRIFKRKDSLFFNHDQVHRAHEFFEKYGGKTLILARFIPFIRAIAPVVAGIGKMNYGQYFFYNVVGALIWAIGTTLLGYWLGATVPNVDRYLLPIIAVIILLSLLPWLIHLKRSESARHNLRHSIRRILRRKD